MTRRGLLVALVAGAVAFACAKNDEAVDPTWGKEPCAHCAMLVSDRRYAAQAVTSGDRKYFDDIGCMVLWMASLKAPPERSWVRAADRWVEAKSARYAAGARTPMDFGFEAVTGEGGVGWEEMRERVIEKGKSR